HTPFPSCPMHLSHHSGRQIRDTALSHVRAGPPDRTPVPVWCPWPLPAGWMVTGVGWVGDDRVGVRASVLACSGPAPLQGGPADIALIAEEPGVGLGTRFAGIPGPDPGPFLEGAHGHAPA